MKNFTEDGKVIGLETGNIYSSSDVVLQENIAGVAVINSDNGVTSTRLDGVYSIPKDSSTFVKGQVVYWNNTSKQATNNPVGAFQIGFCIRDYANQVELVINSGLTSISGAVLITQLALTPAFRGYVADLNHVDNPQENDIAYLNSSQTTWIYTSGQWVNTGRGTDGIQEFSNAATDRYLGLNYEIMFDGIDSFVQFDTATSNILDFSQDWTIGINIRKFVQDPGNIRTLYKSGTNEIAIEYNSQNYRFIAQTQNGFSEVIGGFNTPEPNSRVLLVYTNNNLKFYVNGQLRGDETHTELTTNNNPGTFIEVAKPSFAGNLYFEGNLTELYLTEKAMNTSEIAEFFTTRVINTHSYYNDLSSLDYFVFGQDNYNQVNGKRSVSNGTYLNGVPSDYVEV